MQKKEADGTTLEKDDTFGPDGLEAVFDFIFPKERTTPSPHFTGL
jgi:hypothetical protein